MKKLLGNFIARYSKKLREEKIKHLLDYFKPGNLILDLGVWCKMPEPNPSENWLEKRYSENAQIVTVGLENMGEFKKMYPGVLCVQADGCALPFKDNAFAAVFSNAVLEHVPPRGQLQFIEEFSRVVSQKGMLAVPDRWSPVEIHSRILVLHWLPVWRTLFRTIGEKYWASEEHLSTIFTLKSLMSLLNKCAIPGRWVIKRQLFWFIPVSLLATFEKESGH